MKNKRKTIGGRERHLESLTYIFHLAPFLRRNKLAAKNAKYTPETMNRWNPEVMEVFEDDDGLSKG